MKRLMLDRKTISSSAHSCSVEVARATRGRTPKTAEGRLRGRVGRASAPSAAHCGGAVQGRSTEARPRALGGALDWDPASGSSGTAAF